jgi:hypothetical protein
MPTTSFTITWTAPEYEERPKGTAWYWMSMVVAVLLLAAAMWQSNFLFGFFVVVAELLVLVWSTRKPRTITFQLTDKELTVDERKTYPLHELEDFGSDETGELPAIIVRSRRRFIPLIRLTATTDRLADIQIAFRRVLPEVPYEPTLTETLERFFGF